MYVCVDVDIYIYIYILYMYINILAYISSYMPMRILCIEMSY